MSAGHLGVSGQTMSPESAGTRNTIATPGVTVSVGKPNGAVLFLRSLLLAAVATALIMIGLPAVLALGAAVH